MSADADEILAMVETAQPWAELAECRDFPNPDVFFPEKGGEDQQLQIKVGKLLCSICVVREQCLDYALTHDEGYGIWGGSTPRQRSIIRGERGITRPKRTHYVRGKRNGGNL